ncbi:MAG: hypothetical protein GF331_10720 [Chitinivibrionales bacterium]|nr:hypothetical protein [Chitinivibrionales bacterium]
MKHYQAAVKRISSGVDNFFRKTFTDIDVIGPALDPERLRRARLLVVCTHRSQTDYFLVGYVLHFRGVANMRFAAGDNLTGLPVIGRKFREMGAFSVRRGKTFGRDYVRNLCEKVIDMLARGDTIIVFPEGGRSYEGGMMEIRGGIIGAGVVSQFRDPDAEVLLLPMSICYERLPELGSFETLLRGKSLRRPGQGPLRRILGTILYFGADIVAFSRFLTAYRFGGNYSSVHVDYGAPIPIRDIVDFESDLIEGARDDFSACRLAVQKVSLQVHERFNGLYCVLPSHILARVLRDHGDMDTGEAGKRCLEIVDSLARRGRNMRLVDGLSAEQLVEMGARQLRGFRAVGARNGRVTVKTPYVVRYHAAATD